MALRTYTRFGLFTLCQSRHERASSCRTPAPIRGGRWYLSCSLAMFLLLLLCISTVRALPFHLLSIFPGESQEDLNGALRKAVSDADSGELFEKDVTLLATPYHAPRKAQSLLANLCNFLKKQQPPPALLLSFVGPPLSFYVSLLAAYAKIPVVALSTTYQDQSAKDIHPYFLSLEPSAVELGHAVGIFLNSNGWDRAIILRDDSTFYETFARILYSHHILSSDHQRRLSELASDSKLFQAVTDIVSSEVRMVVVACGPVLARKIFQQARSLKLLNGNWTWILIENAFLPENPSFPVGVMGFRLRSHSLDRAAVRSAASFVVSTLITDVSPWTSDEHLLNYSTPVSCWFGPGERRKAFAQFVFRSLQDLQSVSTFRSSSVFDIYNLVPGQWWRRIGNVTMGRVHMESVLWLSGHRFGPPRLSWKRFRVVTAIAPPFVMLATRVENGSCLNGLPCLKVKTKSNMELSRLFSDYRGSRLLEHVDYNILCVAGISIDLLTALSADIGFDYDLYLVADGFFGTKRGNRWNGMTLDIQSGAAHLAVSAYSLTRERALVIDYSVPFYHSGVSCLTYFQDRDVPLSAFLVPFSPELWIAIFGCLHVTSLFAAIYEWRSPFGLNPWGRMRSKNFSLSSALWVMWSLLFSHLVAFKAPKSWPNKVLINLWGCFSVIFVSSYTANIAAHFAGLFFHLKVDDFHDVGLLNQRTGTAKGSASESYIFAQNPQLWQHIQKYGYKDLEKGLAKLRSGELDMMIGDTAVLDYVRGNDPGCSLHLLGQSLFDDAYAVGMQKGFPLKNQISALILRYNEYGLMENLEKKWFGRVPCFNHSVHRLDKPKPLSLKAVAGVFIMLLIGLGVGILILAIEHAVFKYALPHLRKMPTNCFWRSRNVMFFSQKAKEEARRRKSKSQFFEIIQEIRKVVRLQKEVPEIHSQHLREDIAGSFAMDTQHLLDVCTPPENTFSISVEDLRLIRTDAASFRRHSLDDDLWKRKYHHSPRRKPTSKLSVEDLLLYSMTKEDIIRAWKTSEKKLRIMLKDAVKKKRVLEKKIAFLQKTLTKPP